MVLLQKKKKDFPRKKVSNLRFLKEVSELVVSRLPPIKGPSFFSCSVKLKSKVGEGHTLSFPTAKNNNNNVLLHCITDTTNSLQKSLQILRFIKSKDEILRE